MPRLAVAFVFLFFAVGVLAQTKPSTDPFAVSLAQKSVAALSGGAAVSDVTLNANVISILGSDTETGTGTFEAKGTTESRVDLMLTSAVRTDVRNVANTIPALDKGCRYSYGLLSKQQWVRCLGNWDVACPLHSRGHGQCIMKERPASEGPKPDEAPRPLRCGVRGGKNCRRT